MDEKVFKTHERLTRFPPALLMFIFYRRLVEQGPRPTWLWLKDKLKRRTLGFSPPEISRVIPHVYVGGQHKPRGLDAMRAEGITAILNMREEVDDAERGVLLDAYLWLPTTDDAPPTLEDLERGVAFIEAHAEREEGVYIHCASGVGRAPTMAAAYLVHQGATPEEAWNKIREGRPFVRPTPRQVDVIRKFAARHQTPELGATVSTHEKQVPSPLASGAKDNADHAHNDYASTAFGAPPASSVNDTLENRVQLAYARIAEDPGLTDALTDEPATLLLSWAEQEVRREVANTAEQEEEVAWQTLDPALSQLRRQVRTMAESAADAPDPTAKIQDLIRTH